MEQFASQSAIKMRLYQKKIVRGVSGSKSTGRGTTGLTKDLIVGLIMYVIIAEYVYLTQDMVKSIPGYVVALFEVANSGLQTIWRA